MMGLIDIRLAAVLAVFSISSTALQLSLPIYSMQIFSRVVPTGHFATLVALFLLLIVLNGCALLIDTSRSLIVSRWSLRNHCRSYNGTARLTLSSSYQTEQPLSDLNIVRSFLSGPVAAALLDAPWSIIFVVAMFSLHKILGLVTVTIFGLVISWSCAGYYLTRSLRRLATNERHVEQTIIAAAHADRHVAQAMGLRGAYLRELQAAHVQAVSHLKRLETRTAWLEAGNKFIRNIFQIVILTTAAVLTLTREVEVGAIVASTMLFSRALAPIERISSGFPQIAEARYALSRLKNVAAKIATEQTSLPLPNILGALTLVNVSVKAGAKAEAILRVVQLKVEPGTILVVVGAEGAGKSTLARVLCGALTPDQGEVRLDGFELRQYNPDQLGAQIGYLSDAVRLESGSVASLIARGGTVDMDAVIEAANSAGAHSMIQKLSAGYETIIRPGDMSISAGQRQRVALARAFYRRPKLIVLDEPTAHLDDDGERIIASAIHSFKQAGTTMIIVSRLPTLTHLADRLVLLQSGQIRMDIEGDEVRKQLKIRLATSRLAS